MRYTYIIYVFPVIADGGQRRERMRERQASH